MRLVTRSFAAVALAAACATPHAAPPARTPTPTPVPLPAAIPPAQAPAAPAGVLYGPSALRYVMHQRVHQEQDYGMGTQTQDLAYRVFVSATITGPADTAGYPATLTIDSLVLDSGVVLAPPLSAEGEFRHRTPSDSARARLVGQFLGGFRNFYPRLPATGAAPGANWTDTSTTTDTTSTGIVTTRGVTQSGAAGYAPHGGTQSLEIHFNAALAVSGSGEANGQRFTLEGQTTQTGLAYVAADGRYLGAEVADSTDLAFIFLMGGRAPVRRVAHITVQVLP